ncbi:CD36 family-domain-containing protein [Scenedesmus sp. NREL 46B-D3]|nr:CD36 family-domain-containing protein [Scenedesmus sp. NREL 46B-D3]
MARGSSSSSRNSRNAALVRGCSAAALACLSVGVLVVAAGLILPSRIDGKLWRGVLDTIVWTPQSPPATDARYRNNTAPGAPPAYFRAWLFNITNLHDVRQGAKPMLEQVGPYVYRAYHERHQVMWSGDGRVHFKDYTYFKLDRNLTAADPDAPIATLQHAAAGGAGSTAWQCIAPSGAFCGPANARVGQVG